MTDRTHDWPARLELHPEAFIAPGAVVVGEVRLGARSSVWFNTVVRGDSDRVEIGEDTNVQDNSTVHQDEGQPALIGARCTIGHRAIVHGCVVEDDCLIGMGSVVLSGARIGAGSLIGAASLVREGQIIPPGSLALGSPARVIGPVSDAHRAAIRSGAEHYVALSRSYLARGFTRPHPALSSDTGISARNAGRPMSYAEWGPALAALADFPAWALGEFEKHGPEHWRHAPGARRWSAHDVIGHVHDCDRDVFAPRLERLLRETMPALDDVDVSARTGGSGADPRAALESWIALRRGLAARLAPLGPREWARSGVHSVRGPYSVADMVRGWVEHDLSHRGQIVRALEATR
jgi:carbonic anhydrase/acetyltransferase-like protein (isoleucine patch superfamily)/uncharacterized damage-inducible protein DinB